MSSLTCWNCGENIDHLPKPITRHNNCPKCFESLHCCMLCKHYRVNDSTQCDNDRAEPPVNKENANFCEFFGVRFGAYDGRVLHQDAARTQLEALFKEDTFEDNNFLETSGAPVTKEAQAKAKLDALFGNDKDS